jgi:beta-glucosidase/6-phospho-beta-glucosidase/beta-galactosidase
MPIMITECGVSVPNEISMTQAEATADTFRQRFFTDIVSNLSEAILTDGCNVTAFVAWSLFDNFEWK